MNIDSYIYQGRGTLPLGCANLNNSATQLRSNSKRNGRISSTHSQPLDPFPRKEYLSSLSSSRECNSQLFRESPNRVPSRQSSNKSSSRQSPNPPLTRQSPNQSVIVQSCDPLTQRQSPNPINHRHSPLRSSVSKRSITRTVSGMVKKRKHIVLLGLDGSGKTTILMRLKYSCRVSTAPTIGFNHEKVWGGGYRWSAWDVGGGEKFRPLWVMYARATDGIIFVVNSSSSADVIEEARVELTRVIKASKVTAHSLNTSPPPVLILANFQDRPYSRNSEEIASALGLSETWASGTLWAVAPVCGLSGEGLDSALCSLRTLIDGNQNDRKREEKRWRW